MKINCSIADDLLPLYLDGACSADSRAAVEEHLAECPSCRDKWERMNAQDLIVPGEKPDRDIQMTRYVKKIKRRRLRLAICIAVICALSVCALSLLLPTLRDMAIQSNPIVYAVEDGVYNLTAGPVETSSAQAGEYVLFTNYKQIKVELPKDVKLDGDILLWDVTCDEPIQYGSVDPETNACTFTMLTAACRYRITFSEDADFPITISEGRTVSFWSSLKNVLHDYFTA